MWRVCIIAVTSYLALFPSRTQATTWTPLITQVNEPFLLSVTAPTEPGVTYAYKLCNSQVRRDTPELTATGLACSGQTWQTTWLSTTAAWRTFPRFTAQETTTKFAIRGRVTDATTPYIYVVLTQLKDEKPTGSPFLATTRAEIKIHPGTIPLTIRAYDLQKQPLSHGSIVIRDTSGIRTIPLLETDKLTTLVPQGTVSVMAQTDAHEPIGKAEVISITSEGMFTILLNHEPVPQQSPVLHLSTHKTLVGNPVTATLTTLQPVPVQWFSNGVLVPQATGPHLVYTPTHRGVFQLTARLPDTNESVSAVFTATNPDTVRLHQLIPDSPDGTEQLTLTNSGENPVSLTGWRLQSRTNSTAILLTGTIAPLSELTLTSQGKLRNSGGTYDLRNDLDLVVDSVTYQSVAPGDVVVRNENSWAQPAKTASRSKTAPPSTAAVPAISQSVKGTVTRTSGRTIDITTPEGDAVRIVLHASYTTPKPRLTKGTVITASGTWRMSRRGPYLSVRAGDTLTVIAIPTLKRPRLKPIPRTKPVITPPQPRPPVHDSRQLQSQPVWHTHYRFTPDFVPRLGISGLFTMGTLLLLPFHRGKRV